MAPHADPEGQVTIPSEVRERLGLHEGTGSISSRAWPVSLLAPKPMTLPASQWALKLSPRKRAFTVKR